MSKGALGPRGQWMLTAGGLGLMRPFPGTWGSLPPVVLAGLLMLTGLGPADGWTGWAVYHAVLVLVVLVFTFTCVIFGDPAEARWYKKDPSFIVADEVAGMCLPLMFLPATAAASPVRAAWTLVGCFVAFRVMDILKPWPCRQLQVIPSGWGVVIDDLIAGVYAMIAVQVVTRVAF